MDITDCVITIDAIGCQKHIAEQIVGQNGHYCLDVKQIKQFFIKRLKITFLCIKRRTGTVGQLSDDREKSKNGRIEKRKYLISCDVEYLTGRRNQKNLKSIGKVESTRACLKNILNCLF